MEKLNAKDVTALSFCVILAALMMVFAFIIIMPCSAEESVVYVSDGAADTDGLAEGIFTKTDSNFVDTINGKPAQTDTQKAMSYADVSEKDWFYEDVKYAFDSGLMPGTSDSKFSPDLTASRAMIIAVIHRMEGSPVVNYAMTFKDIPADAWYEDALRWAQSVGIVSGSSADKFRPDDSVTREEFALMLYRYEQYKGGGFNGMWMFRLNFADTDKIASYAYEAVCWMNMKNILCGKDGNIIDPTGLAKRSEIAAMLHRYSEIKK